MNVGDRVQHATVVNADRTPIRGVVFSTKADAWHECLSGIKLGVTWDYDGGFEMNRDGTVSDVVYLGHGPQNFFFLHEVVALPAIDALAELTRA